MLYIIIYIIINTMIYIYMFICNHTHVIQHIYIYIYCIYIYTLYIVLLIILYICWIWLNHNFSSGPCCNDSTSFPPPGLHIQPSKCSTLPEAMQRKSWRALLPASPGVPQKNIQNILAEWNRCLMIYRWFMFYRIYRWYIMI